MRVDKTIEVDVPVTVAYNQWTQFEEFPRFMEGVKQVKQLGDERLHWAADVRGHHREWDAHITRQVPDQVLAWQSEGGALNSGTIVFHVLDQQRTEIEVHLDYEPAGFAEEIGGALGFLSRRVDGDLHRFKAFIEQRGQETGAWRGGIIHGSRDDASIDGGPRPAHTDGGATYTGPDFEGTTEPERGPEIARPAPEGGYDRAAGGTYTGPSESEASMAEEELEPDEAARRKADEQRPGDGDR